MGVVTQFNIFTTPTIVNIYDNLYCNMRRCSVIGQVICATMTPLRNKMATLGVCSDIDPSADPVPDQTMLPTVSLTGSDIPGAFLKPSI